MYRALIALALTTTVVSAQDPKAEALYFPTKVGDKRVYEQTVEDATFTTVDTVIKVEAKGKGFVVTAAREGESATRKVVAVFDVSGRGVSRVSSGGRVDASPVPILKLPCKAGDTWTVEVAGTPTSGPGKERHTVGKEAEVEVPAGKFRAIPMATEIGTGTCRPQVTTKWYAPDVGMVKSVTAIGERDIVTVLKSFTPGK
jgi:hypothetical protein